MAKQIKVFGLDSLENNSKQARACIKESDITYCILNETIVVIKNRFGNPGIYFIKDVQAMAKIVLSSYA